MRTALRLAALLVLALAASVPARVQSDVQPGSVLLRPDRVFDGADVREGWVVLVEGGRIVAAGPEDEVTVPASADVIDLPGMTVLPGLIKAHAHLFLHPYNETPWTEQVLNEPQVLRVARATVHARQTLEAGITTERDLGTEGVGYAGLGLKQAIEEGIIPGPRLLIASGPRGRLPLPGGHHGLVQSLCALLAPLEHTRFGLLRRGPGGGALGEPARDLQQ